MSNVFIEVPPRGSVAPLWQVADEMQGILDALEQIEGIADYEKATRVLHERLDALEGSLEERVGACARVARNAEAEAQMCQDEAARLEQRASNAANRVKHVKAYLLQCLTVAQRKVVQHGVFRVAVAQNGGKQPIDRERIEAELLLHQTKTPDSSTNIPGVRIAWEPKLIIDEAVLPAEYCKPRGQHVRIS